MFWKMFDGEGNLDRLSVEGGGTYTLYHEAGHGELPCSYNGVEGGGLEVLDKNV